MHTNFENAKPGLFLMTEPDNQPEILELFAGLKAEHEPMLDRTPIGIYCGVRLYVFHTADDPVLRLGYDAAELIKVLEHGNNLQSMERH